MGRERRKARNKRCKSNSGGKQEEKGKERKVKERKAKKEKGKWRKRKNPHIVDPMLVK